MDADPKITCIDVRAHGEWATFFVKELPPVLRPGDRPKYAADWAANTSYGTFGHFWSHMGAPFGEFIKNVDTYYLLGKIARKETDPRGVMENVKHAVREARREKSIDAETAREAYDAINAIADEYEHDGSVLCHELYQASELSFIDDWCEIGSMDYSLDAKNFALKLWPEFVRLFREQKEERKRDGR